MQQQGTTQLVLGQTVPSRVSELAAARLLPVPTYLHECVAIAYTDIVVCTSELDSRS